VLEGEAGPQLIVATADGGVRCLDASAPGEPAAVVGRLESAAVALEALVVGSRRLLVAGTAAGGVLLVEEGIAQVSLAAEPAGALLGVFALESS